MDKKILVAEDDPDSRRMLSLFLQSVGYDVVEAADGLEALRKALDEVPDLIIMDMAMPVMDGVNATRHIREHVELRDVPIIGLTGFGWFYEPHAEEAGLTECIQKPVDFLQLEPIVSRYVN